MLRPQAATGCKLSIERPRRKGVGDAPACLRQPLLLVVVQESVDGALVGGASLKAVDFLAIASVYR